MKNYIYSLALVSSFIVACGGDPSYKQSKSSAPINKYNVVITYENARSDSEKQIDEIPYIKYCLEKNKEIYMRDSAYLCPSCSATYGEGRIVNYTIDIFESGVVTGRIARDKVENEKIFITTDKMLSDMMKNDFTKHLSKNPQNKYVDGEVYDVVYSFGWLCGFDEYRGIK